MTRTIRATAGVVAAWLPAAVVAVAAPSRWSRLPETVPTHWSGFGPADGFSAATATWSVAFGVTVAAGLVAAAAAVARRRGFAGARGLFALTGGLGGGALAVWLVSATVAVNGADTRLGWRFLAIPLGLAYALVPYAVAGRQVVRPPATGDGDGPPLPLGPTQRAAWTTVLRSPAIIATTGAALFVTTAVAAFVAPGAWLAVAVVAVALVVFAEVRVTADRRGLRLTAGLVHLPIKRIPLDDIADVSAEHVDPMRWGGWGYRVMPGRSALVLRSGPGLVVEQRDGRRFAVTVDDPRTPAALLRTLTTATRP